MESKQENPGDPKRHDGQHGEEADKRLREILRSNRASGEVGTYAVCSAHPAVITAAIQQSLQDGSILHVEST